MTILLSTLMVLLVAGAMVYPFVRRRDSGPETEEGSADAELGYRWEGLVAGLRDAEMQRAMGTLSEEEYRQERQRTLEEAAALLQTAELERGRRQGLLADLEAGARRERQRLLGGADEDGQGPDLPREEGRP